MRLFHLGWAYKKLDTAGRFGMPKIAIAAICINGLFSLEDIAQKFTPVARAVSMAG
jgi:hypothetical protein